MAREYLEKEAVEPLFTPRFNAVQLAERAEPSTALELLVYAGPVEAS